MNNLFDENFNLDNVPEKIDSDDYPIIPTKRFGDRPIDWQGFLKESRSKFIDLYKGKVENLRIEVKNFEIKNDKDSEILTSKVAEAAELAKILDDWRIGKILDPCDHRKNAFMLVSALNSLVRPLREVLQKAKDPNCLVEIGKRKIGQYQYQKELERRKAEKKAQEAQAKLQVKMDREAKKAGIEAPELPPAIIPEKTAAIRTEAGSANFGTEWVYEVVDISKVPKEYIIDNEKKIKAAIKAGIRKISGLIIKEVPKIGIRTR